MLPDWFWNILYPLSRWLHVVAVTLLVGGTLFYEVVMPVAVQDEKDEQQLSIFGRTRWSFGRIVWLCAILLVLTGSVSSWRFWHQYHAPPMSWPPGGSTSLPGTANGPFPNLWWVFHVGLALVTIAIALRLTAGSQVPQGTMGWMRINFVLMLVVIFLASAARHSRIVQRERWEKQQIGEVQRLHKEIDALKSAAGMPPAPPTQPVP